MICFIAKCSAQVPLATPIEYLLFKYLENLSSNSFNSSPFMYLPLLKNNLNLLLYDFDNILFLYEKSLAYSHCIAGFNGWQRCEGQNYWDVHKNIFTEKRLLLLLQKHFSFSQIKFDRSMRKNVHFVGVLA